MTVAAAALSCLDPTRPPATPAARPASDSPDCGKVVERAGYEEARTDPDRQEREERGGGLQEGRERERVGAGEPGD